MSKRGTMRTTRMRLIECSGCALKLRGSRNPLLAAGLPTCGCGAPMEWASAEDAYACLDGGELYANEAVKAEEHAYDRRLYREQLANGGAGAKAVVGQCGGCHKPIVRVNEHCTQCGFANDLRGRRNRGGYGDSIPF